MRKILILFFFIFAANFFLAQEKSDVEKLRTESGVDPTRITSRVGYTVIFQDPKGDAGMVANRLGFSLGVNRWSFSGKIEAVGKLSGAPGSTFNTGLNDMKFGILNAFYINGPHALAASVEFSIPTGKSGIGSEYFGATPAIVYSLTIDPSLFLAVQPQYTFQLLKAPNYPDLSVLTTRIFLAKFTQTGYFFVVEPRPIYNFTFEKFDLTLSGIIGKSLGGGFNLILLAEFPAKKTTFENSGPFYQFGFNKVL